MCEVVAVLAEACYGLRKLSEVEKVAGGLIATLERRLDTASANEAAGRADDEGAVRAGEPPWVASRLQDFFGMMESPRVGGGKVPLVVHLLAPNQRPVQMTTDLAGFWERLYPQLRRELGRRYPRHAWPENPATVGCSGAEAEESEEHSSGDAQGPGSGFGHSTGVQKELVLLAVDGSEAYDLAGVVDGDGFFEEPGEPGRQQRIEIDHGTVRVQKSEQSAPPGGDRDAHYLTGIIDIQCLAEGLPRVPRSVMPPAEYKKACSSPCWV